MAVFRVSNSFTRPSDTTAYAANDLVANSTTAGSVVPLSFTLPTNALITSVTLSKSTSTATNANFTVHLFGSSPTVSNGDNGAFAPTFSNYLGAAAVDSTGSLFNNNAGAVNRLSNNALAAGGTIYALILAVAAYTPASAEVFTVTIGGITN